GRITAEIEKPLQGGIGHLDALAGIQNEDAFSHAVEERLLAEFAFGGGAPIFLNKALTATAPPQMQTSQAEESNRRNQPGHRCFWSAVASAARHRFRSISCAKVPKSGVALRLPPHSKIVVIRR